MAIFAHPDDETFLAGPVLAKYADEGVEVMLLCVAPSGDRTRRERLRAASDVLGITHVRMLNHAPSPMFPVAGYTAPCLAHVGEPYLIEEIRTHMVDFQPDVIITHSAYGEYGHPDHIIVHRASVSAFMETGPGDARLYALAFPTLLVKLNALLVGVRKLRRPRVGPEGQFDMLGEAMKAKPKSASVDVGRQVGVRRQASRLYAKEVEAAPLPLRALEGAPLWMQRLVFRRATFTREVPVAEGSVERDLFPPS